MECHGFGRWNTRTVGVFLEIRKLFRREFALRLAHGGVVGCWDVRGGDRLGTRKLREMVAKALQYPAKVLAPRFTEAVNAPAKPCASSLATYSEIGPHRDLAHIILPMCLSAPVLVLAHNDSRKEHVARRKRRQCCC